tara:strand:+ start:463 stop:687 length:225 start_codon:yes stop_codon:yes gene_type:complete
MDISEGNGTVLGWNGSAGDCREDLGGFGRLEGKGEIFHELNGWKLGVLLGLLLGGVGIWLGKCLGVVCVDIVSL